MILIFLHVGEVLTQYLPRILYSGGWTRSFHSAYIILVTIPWGWLLFLHHILRQLRLWDDKYGYSPTVFLMVLRLPGAQPLKLVYHSVLDPRKLNFEVRFTSALLLLTCSVPPRGATRWCRQARGKISRGWVLALGWISTSIISLHQHNSCPLNRDKFHWASVMVSLTFAPSIWIGDGL